MTMPNPVAEVVERLRRRAEACRLTHNFLMQKEFAEYADLLERLSRERDTGVPEGFWLAPINVSRDFGDAMLEAMWPSGEIIFDDQFDGPEQQLLAGWVAARAAAPQPPTVSTQGWQDESFQSRVQPWMLACFGAEIAADRLERSDRFIEEALELVQASGYTKDRAHQLVEYVFGRDQGEINQEVGGVMVTLAAYCLAHGVDMHAAAEKELARVWTKVDVIRAKQASKPKGSALPIPVNSPDLSSLTRERDQLKADLERAYEVDAVKTREIVTRTNEYSKVHRERDQAREALAELLETSVLLAGRHEVGMGVWRDKLSPEMLSGMRADFDKLLSVGKRARSVLHPEKEEKA